MRVYSLKEMVKGWFVGSFQPSALETPTAEVAIKYYSAGDSDTIHHHKVAVELTAVVSGRVRMCGQEFTAGQIIRLEPGESTGFEALSDAITVVVKQPSVKGDKYPG